MSDQTVPPPRRGFTQSLSDEMPPAHPVVVGLDRSGVSALALRRAADEAAHRSAHLHVVVGGDAERNVEMAATDERELHALSSILRNQHVTVAPTDSLTPGALIEYCAEVGAALLVVGCDSEAGLDDLENPGTAHVLVDEAECDVLVVHAGHSADSRTAPSAGSVGGEGGI